MGDFGVFPASGQADFLQQRHLRRGAENFQKVRYEKNSLKIFQKKQDTKNLTFLLWTLLFLELQILQIITEKAKIHALFVQVP